MEKISRLPKWYWWLLGGFLLFRLYVICSIGLIDDEAYHWTWAKNLSYSYYDHPGMVAWSIWPFISLFGDHIPVVRLPGLLMFLTIVFMTYQIGKDLFDRRVARLASLLIFVIPLWGFASLGTLPDLPLGAFWILIAYFFWQSVRPDPKQWSVKKSWLLIGLTMGLGMNSKLTCCLIGLGMGLYLILTPRVRHHLRSPWPYLAMLITFTMMIPIFIWNAKHDWATFEYQFFRRHTEAHGADWHRWMQFWSYQWIFMSPGVYFYMLTAFFYGLFHIKDDRWKFIVCLPLPSLMLFYYQPLMSAYKPHWSGPAYMILLFGACKLFLDSSKRTKWLGAFVSGLFLLLLNLIYIPLLTPVVPRVYAHFKDPTTWNPTWDFSNEFYGWLELGEKVKTMQKEISMKTGQAPFLGAQRYELISQLWWATKDKVWQMTNERDQFYFDQPAEEKDKLKGQAALIVNNDKYPRDPKEVANFDSCEKTDFPIYRGGILARTFYIYHCRNYQGLK